MSWAENERDKLIVKLISAVMANAYAKSDGSGDINLNLSVAREMVDKVLVEHEILQIERKQ